MSSGRAPGPWGATRHGRAGERLAPPVRGPAPSRPSSAPWRSGVPYVGQPSLTPPLSPPVQGRALQSLAQPCCHPFRGPVLEDHQGNYLLLLGVLGCGKLGPDAEPAGEAATAPGLALVVHGKIMFPICPRMLSKPDTGLPFTRSCHWTLLKSRKVVSANPMDRQMPSCCAGTVIRGTVIGDRRPQRIALEEIRRPDGRGVLPVAEA